MELQRGLLLMAPRVGIGRDVRLLRLEIEESIVLEERGIIIARVPLCARLFDSGLEGFHGPFQHALDAFSSAGNQR
jgi:hypothetical protein